MWRAHGGAGFFFPGDFMASAVSRIFERQTCDFADAFSVERDEEEVLRESFVVICGNRSWRSCDIRFGILDSKIC